MERDEAVIKLLNIIYKDSELSQRELAEAIGILVGETNRDFIKRKIAEYEEFLKG